MRGEIEAAEAAEEATASESGSASASANANATATATATAGVLGAETVEAQPAAVDDEAGAMEAGGVLQAGASGPEVPAAVGGARAAAVAENGIAGATGKTTGKPPRADGAAARATAATAAAEALRPAGDMDVPTTAARAVKTKGAMARAAVAAGAVVATTVGTDGAMNAALAEAIRAGRTAGKRAASRHMMPEGMELEGARGVTKSGLPLRRALMPSSSPRRRSGRLLWSGSGAAPTCSGRWLNG
mmetsp:Transcript_125171/g.362144  ORF Transcript_125171/g.362144 Transcript_125171/m.362144 type:complete len:245 (-) Transcript_125171:714-1448(-)